MPVLSISAAQVFEGENITVTCQVNSFASERIQSDEIKYSIFRDDALLIREGNYSVTASKETNGKYMCKAEAKSISKKSWSLVFEAKGGECLSVSAVFAHPDLYSLFKFIKKSLFTAFIRLKNINVIPAF